MLNMLKYAVIIVSMSLMISPAICVYAENIDELARNFFCMCGCGILLSECEGNMKCETAKSMKGKLEELVNRGLTREGIIGEMQSIYGVNVLATPPKTPSTLISLWLYPVFGIAIGSIILFLVTRHKGKKWYVTPDDILELSEEEITKLWNIEEERVVSEAETISRYEEIFREEYEKSRRARRKGSK